MGLRSVQTEVGLDLSALARLVVVLGPGQLSDTVGHRERDHDHSVGVADDEVGGLDLDDARLMLLRQKQEANLVEADLREADLRGARVDSVNLAGARFGNTRMDVDGALAVAVAQGIVIG